MNKYQGALCKIVNKLPAIEKALCDDDIMLLEDLCDKEKPIKPYKDKLSYSGYKCSNCKNNIYELRSHNIVNTPYCIWCGQKLDWSDKK